MITRRSRRDGHSNHGASRIRYGWKSLSARALWCDISVQRRFECASQKMADSLVSQLSRSNFAVRRLLGTYLGLQQLDLIMTKMDDIKCNCLQQKCRSCHCQNTNQIVDGRDTKADGQLLRESFAQSWPQKEPTIPSLQPTGAIVAPRLSYAASPPEMQRTLDHQLPSTRHEFEG